MSAEEGTVQAPDGAAASRRVPIAVAVALLLAVGAAWVFGRSDESRMWRSYTLHGALANLVLTWIALASAYVAFPSGPRRRRAMRAVGATLALGFALVVVELPAVALGFDYQRLLGPSGSSNWLSTSSSVNRPDPELLHVHWPNSRYQGDVVGNLVWLGVPAAHRYSVDVQYDGSGFRNDRDLARAEVAVIGDSFIEAAILPREEGVAARLEAAFDTNVVNLGQAAYGLRQELHVLRRYALPLEPRLVVWFLFGGNDLRDVESYEEQFAAGPVEPQAPKLNARLFTRNALLTLSALTTPDRKEPTALARNHSAWYTPAGGARERFYFGAGCDPCSPHQWDVATGTLAEADRLTREANATLVVVYIPRKYRVYRDHVEFEPGVTAADWPVNDLPSRFGAWCAEHAIPYVDLSPRLEASVASGKHPYLVDDVHWNPHGHGLAAEAVLELTERIGWKPRGR